MSELKQLKDIFGLTFLLIAHTPKRAKNKPIDQDNLGGSKMLMNFCDSAFAIAPSIRSSEERYVKQLKTRAGQKASKVLSVRITEKPYLCIEEVGEVYEWEMIGTADSFWEYTPTSELTPAQEAEIAQAIVNGETILHIATCMNIRFADLEVWAKRRGLDYIL